MKDTPVLEAWLLLADPQLVGDIRFARKPPLADKELAPVRPLSSA